MKLSITLLTLTILAFALTAYSQTVNVTRSVTLPVFNAQTSQEVTRVTISLDDIDYERLFKAFDIAFASALEDIHASK